MFPVEVPVDPEVEESSPDMVDTEREEKQLEDEDSRDETAEIPVVGEISSPKMPE